MRTAISPRIGISAIATYEPPWALGNDWFEGMLPRKFVQHTGIESRRISLEDEVAMGVRAVENIRAETGCDLQNCVAVIVAASSLVPGCAASGCPQDSPVQPERANVVARQLAERLGMSATRVLGTNWGCSGYPRAIAMARRLVVPTASIGPHQFMLVVTVNRTSKILDYGCAQTAPVFGDMAQATLLAGVESKRHPVRFALLYAAAENQPADGVFFDYHAQDNVLVPTPGGGRDRLPRRLVFSLNMMGIGDAAPRAMACAAEAALRAAGIRPEDVDFVVPHQAGTGLVRLTAMRLEAIGIRGEVINGWTKDVGNVSSSSVPYALKQVWQRLRGTILCPTAGVGKPGRATVSQGCIILQATAM